MHLFETKLNINKSILFALISIYGLNKYHCQLFIKKLGFSKNLQLKNFSNEQTLNLILLINFSNILIGTNLRKYNFSIFKKFIDIKSLKGIRLYKGLPVRGQRTHTNAKTAKKKINV
jgi:small subunit ribosomal protein S13